MLIICFVDMWRFFCLFFFESQDMFDLISIFCFFQFLEDLRKGKENLVLFGNLQKFERVLLICRQRVVKGYGRRKYGFFLFYSEVFLGCFYLFYLIKILDYYIYIFKYKIKNIFQGVI